MQFIGIALNILLCVFEIYIFVNFWDAFMKPKTDRWYVKPILMACWVILVTFINSFHLAALNLISSLILSILFCIFLYKGSLKYKICLPILTLIIGFALEALSETIWFLIQGEASLDKIKIDEYNVYFLIFITKIVLYIILKIILRFKKNHNQTLNRSLFIAFITYPIASCIIFISIWNSGIPLSPLNQDKIFMLISCVCLLFSNLLVHFLFQRHMELLKEQENMKLNNIKIFMEEKHFSQLNKTNNEHQKLLHDFTKHIRVIGKLAEANEATEILNIIKELDLNIEQAEKNQYCRHPLLNAILCEQKDKANSLNINFSATVAKNIFLNGISDFDIISIMMNLLDNAIEATTKCIDNKYVKINIFMSNNFQYLRVDIENSYDGTIIENSNNFITTKEDSQNHGIGLKIIGSIIDNYSGYIDSTHNENTFTTKIFLYIAK